MGQSTAPGTNRRSTRLPGLERRFFFVGRWSGVGMAHYAGLGIAIRCAYAVRATCVAVVTTNRPRADSRRDVGGRWPDRDRAYVAARLVGNRKGRTLPVARANPAGTFHGVRMGSHKGPKGSERNNFKQNVAVAVS